MQKTFGKEAMKEPVKERKETREGKQERAVPIASPSLTPLPAAVIPAAQAAAHTAAAMMSPQVLAIYFHIVGTIFATITKSGDSLTEFILNAPSFKNSKFFGASIAIERFATAPKEINIRMTGASEAVDAFNKNIPNLLSVFQNGNFAFKINRIETALEKPLFHRKESAGEKGDKR